MAIKKDAPVQKLDAAVAAVLDGGQDDDLRQRRERAQDMTPGERRKADKDRKRNRATYDLPEELERIIEQTAARLSVPKSEVATWLMIRGVENTSLDELIDSRNPSRSMRYEYVLEIPEVPRGLRK